MGIYSKLFIILIPVCVYLEFVQTSTSVTFIHFQFLRGGIYIYTIYHIISCNHYLKMCRVCNFIYCILTNIGAKKKIVFLCYFIIVILILSVFTISIISSGLVSGNDKEDIDFGFGFDEQITE